MTILCHYQEGGMPTDEAIYYLSMKTLKDFNVGGKRVIVRCDFNVPLSEAGEVEDDYRIREALPTINYLAQNGAKVILMSHLDPESEGVTNISLAPVAKRLSDILQKEIKLAPDCVGNEAKEIVNQMKDSDILLLENLKRHEGEIKNDAEFAKELASLADIYVNDAFGTSHRKYASVQGITQFITSCAGMLLEKEITALSRVMDNPSKPFVAIIGGAKISSKANMIRSFMESGADVIVGGKIANTILSLKDILAGREVKENERKAAENINLDSPDLYIPIDLIASEDLKGETGTRITEPNDVKENELALDIGPKSVEMFSKIIKSAKTIIWAGPMGLFEEEKFANGTREIAKAIANNSGAYKIAGGGDTISAISKFNLSENFNHISTGGSAMLSFLGGDKLPAIEALE